MELKYFLKGSEMCVKPELPLCDIYPSSSYVMMYAYIAWALFTNLETFSTLIDFQKRCYGKYTPKYVFLLLVYMYLNGIKVFSERE
jgi:hypothetical protein